MNPKRKASIPETPKSIFSNVVESTANNVNRAIKKGKRQLEKIVNMDILSNTNNDPEIVVQKIDIPIKTNKKAVLEDDDAVKRRKYSSPARIKTEVLQALTPQEQAAVRVQRAFRRKCFVREVEKLIFRNKMRTKVVDELWVTEGSEYDLFFLIKKLKVSYFKSLSELVHTFKNPIKEKGLLSDDELDKLFIGLDDIYAFHKILLEDITQRTKNWTSGKPIGDIFVKLAPFMKIYNKYIINFASAHKTVEFYMNKKKSFSAYVKSCKSKNQGEGEQYLLSLMITPIQRIPRYELLIKELIKNTSREHEDYEQLCMANVSIKEIAEFHNEKRRKDEDSLTFHSFEAKQFKIPAYCEYCSELVWGVLKRCYVCKKCKIVGHKECVEFHTKVKECKVDV